MTKPTGHPGVGVRPRIPIRELGGEEAFRFANHRVAETNSQGFELFSSHGGALLLLGSFDLDSYHTLEVEFPDVAYVSLPTTFSHPEFRTATPKERAAFRRAVGIEDGHTLYCIEAETGFTRGRFFEAARSVSVRSGTVYHYTREPLGTGEEIAPWVEP